MGSQPPPPVPDGLRRIVPKPGFGNYSTNQPELFDELCAKAGSWKAIKNEGFGNYSTNQPELFDEPAGTIRRRR